MKIGEQEIEAFEQPHVGTNDPVTLAKECERLAHNRKVLSETGNLKPDAASVAPVSPPANHGHDPSPKDGFRSQGEGYGPQGDAHATPAPPYPEISSTQWMMEKIERTHAARQNADLPLQRMTSQDLTERFFALEGADGPES